MAFREHLTSPVPEKVGFVIQNLRKHSTLCELETPLTSDFYMAPHHSNRYGHEKSLSQIGPNAPPINTDIAGLYHCGQSTASHGVVGSLTTGVMAAEIITGKSADELLVFETAGGTVRCHQHAQPNPALNQT